MASPDHTSNLLASPDRSINIYIQYMYIVYIIYY